VSDGVIAGWDGTGRPSTGENGRLQFNGREDRDEDYETFTWPADLAQEEKDVDPAWVVDFCKTGRLPYDRFVVACLLAAKSVLDDALRLYSDGGADAFSDPAVAELYSRSLGEAPPRAFEQQ
jgi:hypothetical protein